MSTINTQSAVDPLSGVRYEEQNKASGSSELGRNEFMELMIAQLENQSPLEPQDNGAFISQLAEFSALEEMQGVSASIDDLTTQYKSTQALQASAMVGRSVLVPGGQAPLAADGSMSGLVELPASTRNLSISILNGSGELVNRFELGPQAAGTVPFMWDGTNSQGEYMPYDEYTIKAEASQGGDTTQLNTLLSSTVNSVSIGQTGAITLNLFGMGAVPLEDVREIN